MSVESRDLPALAHGNSLRPYRGTLGTTRPKRDLSNRLDKWRSAKENSEPSPACIPLVVKTALQFSPAA